MTTFTDQHQWQDCREIAFYHSKMYTEKEKKKVRALSIVMVHRIKKFTCRW